MAYTPVQNDILEARIFTFDPTTPTQLGVNVVRFRVSLVNGTGGTLTAMAASLDGVVAPLYKALLSSTVQYRGIMLQKIWPFPRTFAEFSNGNNGTGSGAATQVPTQVCGLIKAQTAKAGRQFRGRIYIPFLGTGSVGANGNPTAPYVTALQNLAAAVYPSSYGIIAGGNGFTMIPVIFHNKGYGKPPTNLKGTDDVVSVVASPLFATQRRRGNYGRSNPGSPI